MFVWSFCLLDPGGDFLGDALLLLLVLGFELLLKLLNTEVGSLFRKLIGLLGGFERVILGSGAFGGLTLFFNDALFRKLFGLVGVFERDFGGSTLLLVSFFFILYGGRGGILL
jgi:hypothetical protein